MHQPSALAANRIHRFISTRRAKPIPFRKRHVGFTTRPSRTAIYIHCITYIYNTYLYYMHSTYICVYVNRWECRTTSTYAKRRTLCISMGITVYAFLNSTDIHYNNILSIHHKFRRDKSILLLLLLIQYTGRLCALILHADWRTHIDKCRPMYNNNTQSV